MGQRVELRRTRRAAAPHARPPPGAWAPEALEPRMLLAAAPAFDAARAIQVGPDVSGLAAADVNGDGKVDLIVAQSTNGTVSVLRGNADGTFAPKVEYAVSELPARPVVADFTGDGKPDILLANSVSSKFILLKNAGDGTFPTRATYTAPNTYGSLAAGDVDGDGDLDVGVAVKGPGGSSAYDLYVWRNAGNGTLTATAGSYPAGDTVKSVAAADLNGDGRAEFAVLNVTGANGSVGVFRNNGDGTFAPRVSYATPQPTGALAAADFTGDGRPDLAVGTGVTSGTVRVLPNDGSGAFGTGASYAVIGQADALTTGDLDADGRLDLVAVCEFNGVTTVLRNTGDDAFAPAAGPYMAGHTAPLAVDVDADGRLDLAVTDSPTRTLVVLRNRGDGTFASRADHAIGVQAPRSIAAADFDGDGRGDVVEVSDLGAYVGVFRGLAAGGYAPRAEYPVDGNPRAVAAADFNGDGRPDLVSSSRNGGSVSVLLNRGDGGFAPGVSYPAGAQAQYLAVGDVDGDGRPDVAVTHAGDAKVSVLRNNGDGTFAAKVDYPLMFSATALAMGDLDGDGRAELIVGEPVSSVAVLRNNGNGTFAARVSYPAALGPANGIAVADLDGDGKADLAVTGGSAVSTFRGKGDATFAARVEYPLGAFTYRVAAGDLNRDGRPDLVVASGSALHVLQNVGGGAYAIDAANGAYAISPAPESVIVADLDADGWPEVAVANSYVREYSFSVYRNVTPPRDVTPPTVTAAPRFNFDAAKPSISIAFSEAVDEADARRALTLGNTTTGQTIAPAAVAFALDPVTHVGIWTFPGLPGGALPDGDYTATIAAELIRDAADNALAGGDPTLSFFSLAADANRDRSVDFKDLVVLAQHYNTSGGERFADGDYNYDGNVNFTDLTILAQRYNTSLRAPAAAGPPTSAAAPVAKSTVKLPAAQVKTVPPPRPFLVRPIRRPRTMADLLS